MTSFLDRLPAWATVAILLVGFPIVAVVLQAAIRRKFPSLSRREHNSVAGFLLAVIGVIYAVTVGFIIASQWENYTIARDRTYEEAFKLAGVAEASVVLGPEVQAEITKSVIDYNLAVINWWPRSGQVPAAADPVEDQLLAQILATLGRVKPTTEVQTAFIRRATDDVLNLDAENDRRLHQASRAHLDAPLWVVIIVSSAVTVLFCLLFGLENPRLHYLMAGAVSLAIASNLVLVVLLDHPLSGVMPVSPDAYESVVADLSS